MSLRILTILLFCFSGDLVAQESVHAQMDALAATLVRQINNHPEVNTVAVAEFTDYEYTSNALHRYLSDELANALIMHPDRNFTVINRSRLKILLEESKLDADGLMDPTNLPRLGRLNGIEMVVGAQVRTTSDYLALSVKGIEVATSNALVAGRQSVTFVPSLKDLLDESGAATEQGAVELRASDSRRTSPAASQSVQQFTVSSEGCQYEVGMDQVQCSFSVTNNGGTTNLSVYAQRTQVFFPNLGTAQRAEYITLADKDGRQRVSALIRSGETVPLTVAASTPAKHQQVARLLINCHAQNRGVFDVEFSQLSVQ